MDKVIIGGGQGFWGDSNDAAIHMVHTAPLDYMACDYLAELTMSILARQKIKNPAAGFARDFLGLYKACGEEAFRKNIGILTNAGGMNIEVLEIPGHKLELAKVRRLSEKEDQALSTGEK